MQQPLLESIYLILVQSVMQTLFRLHPHLAIRSFRELIWATRTNSVASKPGTRFSADRWDDTLSVKPYHLTGKHSWLKYKDKSLETLQSLWPLRDFSLDFLILQKHNSVDSNHHKPIDLDKVLIRLQMLSLAHCWNRSFGKLTFRHQHDYKLPKNAMSHSLWKNKTPIIIKLKCIFVFECALSKGSRDWNLGHWTKNLERKFRPIRSADQAVCESLLCSAFPVKLK